MPSSIRAASPQPVSSIASAEPLAPSLPPRPKNVRIASQQQRPLSKLFSSSKTQPLGAPIPSAAETSGAHGPSLEAPRSPVPRQSRGAARARPLSMSDAPKHDTSLQLFNDNAYRTGVFAAPSSKGFLGIEFNAHERNKVIRRLQDQSQALLEGKMSVEHELHHIKDEREQLNKTIRELRRSLNEALERSHHYKAGQSEHQRFVVATHARVDAAMDILNEVRENLESAMQGGDSDGSEASAHDGSSVHSQATLSDNGVFRYRI
jgi:hypothetical protein